MAVQEERRTKQLREYVNDQRNIGIRNITEDETYIYFNSDNVCDILLLKTMDYDVLYQETPTHYHVRVLKPNWFTKQLEEDVKKC